MTTSETTNAQTEQPKPQQAAKLYTAQEVIDYLIEKLPNCFFKENAKPLKIGILNDLVEALKEENKYSKTAIRHGIQLYTKSWDYLGSCVEGATRIDINGNEAGTVSAEHAAYAKKTMEDSKKASEKKQKEKAQKAKEKKEAAQANGNKDQRNNDKKGFKKPFVKKPNGGNRNFKPNNNNRNGKGPMRLKRTFKPEGFVNPTIESLSVGDRVYVQIGYDPTAKKISGRVKQIVKDEVYVDLINGASVNLSVDNLYIYDESRVTSNKEE